MNPGDHVVIVDIIDLEIFGADDKARARAESFVGKRGVVIRRDANGLVGNTKDDPLVLVAVHGHGRYHFWTEELEASP